MNLIVREGEEKHVAVDEMKPGEIGQVVGYGSGWAAYVDHYMLKSGRCLVDLSDPTASWSESVGNYPYFKLRLLPKGTSVTLIL